MKKFLIPLSAAIALLLTQSPIHATQTKGNESSKGDTSFIESALTQAERLPVPENLAGPLLTKELSSYANGESPLTQIPFVSSFP
jgi:hypothetical protein